LIKICRLTDLKNKEVICICNGCRLGFVSEVEFDICSGRIVAVLVPGEMKIFSFGRCEEIRIYWDQIEKIGPDIILVDIKPEELLPKKRIDTENRKKRKKFINNM